MKIQKNIYFFWGGGRGGVSGRGGSGWGVRVDVNEELKFLGKLKKKIVGGSGGWVGGLSGRLGGGGMGLWGQGGCE